MPSLNDTLDNLEESVYSFVGQLEVGGLSDLDTNWEEVKTALLAVFKNLYPEQYHVYIDDFEKEDENISDIHLDNVLTVLKENFTKQTLIKKCNELIETVLWIKDRTGHSSTDTEDEDLDSQLTDYAYAFEDEFINLIEGLRA